jgi:predicted RNA-binding protein YlxR (DUF448 family)
VACGSKRAKQDLARVVRSPQGTVAVDLQGKASGRGAYLCPKAACWELALSRGRLSRSLGVELSSEDREAILRSARSFYEQPDAG